MYKSNIQSWYRIMKKPNKHNNIPHQRKHKPGYRFRPFCPLPDNRTYCGNDRHLRGCDFGNANCEYDQEISKSQRKQFYDLISAIHSEGVSSSSLVMALLDCAVDLTASAFPSEGQAYTPFVEAMADLFNHYAATGVSDISTPWDRFG